MNQVIYFIGCIFLMILLMRTIFKQKEMQFELLKKLFPKRLEGTDSYYSFMFSFKGITLPTSVMVWIYMPIYYNIDFPGTQNKDQLEAYRFKLLKLNKRLLAYFLSLIVWLFVFGKVLL